MRRGQLSVRQHSQGVLTLAHDWFDVLFDNAPVMMNAVDRDLRIVKVNHRWLETLGYERDEVLGRKYTDFLTEESRIQFVTDTLPLMWRTGPTRSVGRQFVRNDGTVLDILVDADVCPTATCCSAYAALRTGYDHLQWEQASDTLRGLREITHVQHELERGLSPSVPSEGTEAPGIVSPAAERGAGDALAVGSPGAAIGAFFEVAQDISGTLRGLLRIQDEWMGAAVEQQRELLLVTKRIEKDLAELTDMVATNGPRRIRVASEGT